MSGHRWPIGFGMVVAITAAPAFAQDLTQGKTPAQLFAGDCAACHKSPQGLARGDTRSVASFLTEHYTTKPDMAQALAAYLVGSGGSARGQPAPTERNRASASNDLGRGVDSLRPRVSIPIPLLGDDSTPPEPGDAPKPAKPRPASIATEGKPDGDPRRQRAGEGSRPADERSLASRGPNARRNGEEDPAADSAKPKPRATRPDEGRKPADAAGPPARVNSYARTGASDKDNAGESAEVRANKLRAYATSGEPAPTTVVAPAKAVATPPIVESPTTTDSVTPSANATPANVSNPSDGAVTAKVDSSDASVGDEAPNAAKPRKPAPGDAAKPQDGSAKRPHRADANNAPQSPMSFFGRILSGGARTRSSDAPN